MCAFHRSVKLWQPGGMPFPEAVDASQSEYFMDDHDSGIMRITQVSEPEIVCFPASGAGKHPAVLVAPGGAYEFLSWTHEGSDICGMLNASGFSAFLLKYRCPGCREAAFADAARAIRLIRLHADALMVDAGRLGMMGFSAGGHLTAMCCASAETEPYPAADEADKLDFRPDFAALIYPAYLTGENLVLNPEFKVTGSVPPTFLVQAGDDEIRVENSLAWYQAVHRAGGRAEMHIYAEGGHGYGLLRTGHPISEWGLLACDWLRRTAGVK